MFSIFKVDFGKLILLQLQIHYHSNQKDKKQSNYGIADDSVENFLEEQRIALKNKELSYRRGIKQLEEEGERKQTEFKEEREKRNPSASIQQGVLLLIFLGMGFLYIIINYKMNIILLLTLVCLIGGVAFYLISSGWSDYKLSEGEIEYKKQYKERMLSLHRNLLAILRSK